MLHEGVREFDMLESMGIGGEAPAEPSVGARKQA